MKYEESNKVELKQEIIKDLDKEIIAFLNSNGGTIYIGVDDTGKVLGIPHDLKDKYDQQISSIISGAIKPNARPFIKYTYNNDNILEIQISKGSNKPYFLSSKGPKPSGTYIRFGRSKRQATDDEILSMIRDSSGWLWEEQISKEQDLTFSDFAFICKRQKIEFGNNKYQNLRFKTNSNEFTNLAYLCSDQNPIEIKFAVYDKNLNFKIKKEFTGSIISIADQLLEYAELFNDISAQIIPGQLARVETKSFPGSSLREGILNAICHAAYDVNSNIKVEFFPALVKITNPGSIYGGGTLEDILMGIQSFRNPGLVLLLSRLGYIENYGTGIQRIVEAYRDSEKKPSFYISERYFQLTLPNINFNEHSNTDVAQMSPNVAQMPSSVTKMSPNVVQDVAQMPSSVTKMSPNVAQDVAKMPSSVTKMSPNVAQDVAQMSPNVALNPLHESILQLVNENPKISRKAMAEKLNVSKKTIERAIKEIPNLKFVGHASKGYWALIKDNNHR